MSHIISNNDARLFIEIGGAFREIPNMSEFEFNIEFDTSDIAITGEMFVQTFVGQGSLSGSCKILWTTGDDIISKFLEDLAVPDNINKLNGIKFKVVNLHPLDKKRWYREISFTGVLKPNGSTVESDLSSPSYLNFEILYQGDFVRKLDNDVEQNDVPGKVFFDIKNSSLEKSGTTLVLKNASFILLTKNSTIFNNINDGFLHLSLTKISDSKPHFSLIADKDAKTHFTNVATQKLVADTFQNGIYKIPQITGLIEKVQYVISGIYEYYNRDGVKQTITLEGANVLTEKKSGIYIPILNL